ncbi:molecular chaperone DnaJ [Mycoplasmopsis canis UFG1]|uniref:molecular chaperone DnaJ n=1 Tax=Mycoplasmopsis canis TaxID=29555 RepID=UPI00025B08B1|nr:molecular chaperone DnaJ [Mycoplasmopsis canis]EIE42056.1 molecular chaperone DnaJ [Mycoplasmopsis canis UFG1]
MSNKRDYYDVLGVEKNATEQEIKTAYRSLAKKYHPDKLKDGTSDKKMQELNEAYEILSNPEKRNIYDNYGHDAANGRAGAGGGFNSSDFSGFGGFEDIFENIFGGFGSSRKRNANQPMKGPDVKVSKRISFMQSINGDELKETMDKFDTCLHCGGSGAESNHDIETCSTCNGSGYVSKRMRSLFGLTQQQVACDTCGGTGKKILKKCTVCKGHKYVKTQRSVKIPIAPGTENGTLLKLQGYGEAGTNGGPSGDLYIQIVVEPHKHFERRGNDLYLEFPVSFIDLMLEKNVQVPTPYGNVIIALKRTYETGQVIRLDKKGVKSKHFTGDLKIILKVVKPEISKSNLKEMIKVFETLEDTTNDSFVKEINKTLK